MVMETSVGDADSMVEVEDEGGAAFAREPKMVAPGISQTLLVYLEGYGWFILLGLVVFIYVRAKYKRQNPPRNDGLEYDSDQALARQAAMDAARQKMQERLDARAAQFVEEQKKKEEEKRRAKIEDWERHKEGKGYRSKYKPEEARPSESTKPAAKKKSLRDPDYNPLSGDGGSCSWRPGRARGGGGG